MSESDLSPILRDWPYEAGHISVRRIVGADHREKIQMRLDLGVLQMEVCGRPDGQRPHGHESLLDYHLDRLRVHRETHEDEESFTLTSEQCRDLRAEASMFYHRYLALFVLEEYEGVRRDTARNLAVIDLCRRFGPTARDRMVLDQFRPYIIMMHTRACVHLSADKSLWTRALAEVEEGLRRIRDYFIELQSPEDFAGSPEARLLRRLRRQIRRRISTDPRARLSRRLDRAVREERYEEAARLRDQLRDLPRQSVAE